MLYGITLRQIVRRNTIAFAIIASLTSLLTSVVAIECHANVIETHIWAPFAPSLSYGVAFWCWWGIVASGFWLLLMSWRGASTLAPSRLLAHLPIGVICVLLHAFILQVTIAASVQAWPQLRLAGYDGLHFFGLRRLGSDFLVYALIIGTCLIVHLYLRSQDETLRSVELEKELSVAHLRALQMQIDPHFLFNTLNSVTALVKFDRKDEALETLANLNALLRTTLATTSPEKVALGKEFQMIESYLAIEQVRFADRLRVDMNVDPQALRGLVPCFLLQPLVENAIRHGIAHCIGDGIIETSAQRVGQHLHLFVRDNGPGVAIPSHRGHGIGLRNTRERLAHFYRNDYDITAKPLEAGGFEVFIKIPYEQVL